MFKRYLAISMAVHILVVFLLLFVIKPKRPTPKYTKDKPLIAQIVPPEPKPAPQTNIPPATKPHPDKRSSSAPEAKKSPPSVSAKPPESPHKPSPPKPKVYEPDRPIAKAPQPPAPPLQTTPKGLEAPAPKESVPSNVVVPVAPPTPEKTEGSQAYPPAPPKKPSTPSLGNLFDSDVIEKHAMASRKKDETTRHSANTSDNKNNSLSLDVDDMRYAIYMRRVKDNIESVWQYPQAEARKKIYGDLYISFTINKNGTLGTVEVVRTSGHKALDEAAVRSIRDAAPFWPLPEEWGKESFTIRGHFVYNMYTF
ncbi:MAG: TonB family protein [Candidatus Magnetobacterium sp. LHC-1]|uniref:TonB family protein n=1 Tax=Candidatus Magnetobacterium casense TaxID=1455061 RepID=A0ABS6RZJ6_9BACT|nr:TonB family protein [Candidatus Magnetobacterium casensis]MBF0606904.1 TonB family protein [Nitrospirota bacterium]MBV6341223.1 TonB family protein [Candidatus Magnetobacterium casensis]